MGLIALALLVIAYLPGALLLRAPTARRPARAGLAPEERLFWAVFLSLALSSSIALLLAALGAYSLARVVIADAAIALFIAVWSGGDLRLPPDSARLRPTAVLPAALVAGTLYLAVPPAEAILGGKDPGVYLNEGVQIARRGSLVITDPVVATVPAAARDLFFPPRGDPTYYGLRFMGFFVLDPRAGTVVGQFPHLYPLWIALGYDLAGLPGARAVVSVSATAGVAAVYFAGAWLLGRAAAFAGAALLAVNVAQVWFGRYSNSELGLQALAFAALLALARAEEGRGALFAALAATLLGLALFLRLEGVLLVAAIGVALGLRRLEGRVPHRALLAGIAVWLGLAGLYYSRIVRPYRQQLVGFLWNLSGWQLALLGLVALGAGCIIWFGSRLPHASRLRRVLPPCLAAAMVIAAAYAYFVRRAGGRLAPHDADALRTFAHYYVSSAGLAAGLLGFVLATRRRFWQQPAWFVLVAIFAFLFFYKVRIVPEHFWMARRFLPVILPATCLMIATAALWPLVAGTPRPRAIRFAWAVVGSAAVVLLGWRYWQASRPLLAHVEYRGATAHVERLAAAIGEHDLLIVESRQASDVHVLALPLAYVYGRSVLVLDSRQPDKDSFVRFLAWARRRYRNVFFLGGGGTDLVSPAIAVEPVAGERFQLPEYDTPRNRYPRTVRHKEFDFSLYRFVAPRGSEPRVVLDIGATDDLHTVRFHAKERHGTSGISFRWSRDESYITLLPPARPRRLTIWLSADGRPPTAPAARVHIYLEGRLLGSVTTDEAVRPYVFDVPPDLAASFAAVERAVRITIRTTTWNPLRLLGVPDDRDLGVMVDRVELQ
jgi:hypothetical protein